MRVLSATTDNEELRARLSGVVETAAALFDAADAYPGGRAALERVQDDVESVLRGVDEGLIKASRSITGTACCRVLDGEAPTSGAQRATL